MINKDQIGSVLVVGGGIAGIQSSLDLADSGYKVYLIESDSAIGGHMAQLDKTFPTNDCSMCTISPKLVSAGLHRNIEIITNVQLFNLEGDAGDFKATVHLKPTYIDQEKCNGCGLCADVCPVNVPDEYNQELNYRKAVSKMYPQAVPNKYTITKLGRASCHAACPLGGDPSGYVALTAQGRYEEAINLVRERNPFPAICGRVCHNPCEAACNRAFLDKPLSIGGIKRFLADWHAEHGEEISPEEKQKGITENGKKVAVIGSGPSGLTAALELRKLGYAVTIYEAQPVAGGMLALGLPEYRLPSDVIRDEIQDILDYGIDLKTNSPVKSRTEIDRLFDDGCCAVLVAVGAHKGRQLGIEGEDLENVYNGVDFLRDVRLEKKTSVSKRVVVLGGGNVALDSARSALRLGADSVTLVCLEEHGQMPGHREEIEWAEEEGVTIRDSSATKRIIEKDGRFAGLELLDVASMEFVDGRLDLKTVEGTEAVLEADELIVAIGQMPDLSLVGDEGSIALTHRGTLDVNEDTLMTSEDGVFSAGDSVRGPASVIEAIADGRRAAFSIDAFVRGVEYVPEYFDPHLEEHHLEAIKSREEPEAERREAGCISLEKRKTSFDEVSLVFSEDHAKEEADRCLYCSVCSNCRRCAEVCEADAICYNDGPKEMSLDVGAVILAPGFHLYDSRKKQELGYKRFPNVVSALDYERILSASGPTMGHVLRLSDQKEPKKIAFVQCVGSRDKENKYCSSVCCTFAIKQAILTKTHIKDAECKVFVMDVRAFGKGFDAYYQRAIDDYGVEFVYTRPSSIRQDFRTENLFLQSSVDGQDWSEEEFDMVVLSAGLCQDEHAREMAGECGIDLNEYAFAQSEMFSPIRTNRNGIFMAGAFEEPKDIPDTVTQASAAAAEAMELLAGVRGTEVTEKMYPPEKDVTGQEPRIGVFVCHCGSNIHGVIDCEKVAEYASTLKNVAYTNHLLYTCSPDGLETIKEMIAEHDLNRVVVASCTPRTHEPLFQENMKEAGLNPYLFEMANIRDQCTWVHADMGQMTEDKATDLVRMAVGRARTIEALHSHTYIPKKDALIIGGGISGMTSALSIARQGYDVCLVEKSDELGGNARKVGVTVEGTEVGPFVDQLISEVEQNARIKVLKNSELADCHGFMGSFTSHIQSNSEEEPRTYELEHGVAIVATGAEEMKPSEYSYGSSEKVMTQQELETVMHESPERISQAKELVMIQCVGSREKDRNVCSRVCCTEAVKNAIALKKMNPELSISILYRDIRTYGFKEKYYTEAREMGVMFFRYDLEKKPVVIEEDGRLVVKMKDLNSGHELEFVPDVLALSAGMVMPEGAQKVGTAFKVPINLEGFFQEAHVKLRPVDFASDGIFLCGTCHSPKFIRESITQAKGAAARAMAILSKSAMEISCVYSHVDPDKCAACLTCVRTCPYNVPVINKEGVAEIEPAICHGCGICASECPAKAIELMHYKDKQIVSKTSALYLEKEELKENE